MTQDPLPLPERIGPYRILDVLGQGGMGVVYEAEESGDVRRRVALKVIRTDLASRESLVRFEAERQALALMDHAGIARVFAAGHTEDGRPYVAMELVRGVPITEFCDAHRLGVAQRVDLFIAVCNAVQHAHQKGVIHRDLKPTNILVVEADGVPRPKIIDFGIAKALGSPLTEHTLVTHAGVALGTAAYMSPEQAEAPGLDVDTRTDIYSLGVVLYELLVGRLPLEMGSMGYHAFIVKLTARETPPTLPSQRVAALGRDAALVAHDRGTEPERLRRTLQGDLDWIALKALEPERTRRYATANGLALDLQRARAHEPVSARPPSARYWLGKFVRRHRVGVAATAVAAIALVSSTVLASVGLVRAQRAERRAEAEAIAAREVTDFVVGLFRVFDPDEPRGTVPARDITARELLDRGAERAANELAAQPEQQGRILKTIGDAYMSLGLFDEASRQLERALLARERSANVGSPELAETHLALGQAARSLGEFHGAERHLLQALELRQASTGTASAEVAQVLAALAIVRWRQGRLTEAESLYLRAVRIDEAVFDADHPRLARDLMGLGIIYYQQARYAEAEPNIRRSLEIREASLGPDHPELASALNNLGAIYYMLGRYADALRYYERTHGIYQRTLDPMHPNVASVLNNLGESHWKLGRAEVAEPLLRRALAIKEARLAPGNPSIASTLNALDGVLVARGRASEAETAYRRALDIRVRHYPPGDPNIVESTRELAALLRGMGRRDEARALEARLAAR